MGRGLLLAALASVIAPAAWASSKGIAGFSGKATTTCSACHSTGIGQINVNLSGPSALKLGATGTYKLTIEMIMGMSYKAGGLDVAASGGTFTALPSEPSTKVIGNELVHSSPKAYTWPGTLSWSFTWTAPNVPGVYTLFGAGLAANDDGKSTQDRVYTDTLDVSVGTCVTPSDCNDNNVCTIDSCSFITKQCQYTKVNNCCNGVTDCEDNNPCTTDVCSASHQCQHQTVSGCCTTDAQCADIDQCTVDSCNLISHTCDHAKIPSCCTAASQCDDGNKCTSDACNYSTHLCTHLIIPACCKSNADCADSSACTTDTCDVATGICLNATISGCCTSAAQCDDKNSCTVDTCSATSTCVNTPVPNCCTTPAVCDDGNPCTTDGCVSSQCVHASIPGCVTDAGSPKPDGAPPGDGKAPVGDGKPSVGDSKLPVDGAPSAGDRSVAKDAAPPSGDASAPSKSGGCCRVGHTATGETPLVLLGLAILLALRRRR